MGWNALMLEGLMAQSLRAFWLYGFPAD